MPPESDKVLTVYECARCASRATSSFTLGSCVDPIQQPHDIREVRYLPEAETVPLEVAEGLYEAVQEAEKLSWLPPDSIDRRAGLMRDVLKAALHTYRQSVPERTTTEGKPE
jgi:hypothetical protein